MCETRNANKVSFGRPKGKKPAGRPRRRWTNIKIDLREIELGGMDSIRVARDKYLVNSESIKCSMIQNISM
jgi:hypothetical protein